MRVNFTVFDKFEMFSLNMFVDNDGPYYWHIKSGTIQREMPIVESEKEKSDSKSSFKESDFISSFESSMTVTRSSTSSALDLETDDRKRKEELALKYVGLLLFYHPN